MAMQRPLCAIRHRLFVLTAYSLTSAAMMGSSIGLVLYQSHQLRFLNPYRRHHHQAHLHSHPLSPTTQPHSDTLVPPLSSHHDDTLDHPSPMALPAASAFDSALSLLQSMWFPLLLWAVSLAIASYLSSRNRRCGGLVPERLSARTGVLVSQAMFAIFWVLLGCMQQVQEVVRASFRAQHEAVAMMSMQQDPAKVLATTGLPTTTTTTSTLPPLSILDQPSITTTDPAGQMLITNPRQFLHAARVPLWIVWHMAIVLLGAGTGLLTSCCHHLEQDVYLVYCEAQHDPCDEKRGNTTTSSTAVEHYQCAMADSHGDKVARSQGLLPSYDHNNQRPSLPGTGGWEDNNKQNESLVHWRYNNDAHPLSTAASTTSYTPFNSPLLSRVQRGVLALLLVTLLMGQVWLFQWMVQVDQSETNYGRLHHRTHRHVKVSSALASFGLFFGLAMMALGARLLPRHQPRHPVKNI